jgi:hypothetical protein
LSGDIALDNDFIVADGVADILNRLIIMSSPEEGSVAVWNEFTKHIKSSIGTLIHSMNPMLNSDVFTRFPVWKGAHVSGSVDIWYG